MSKHVMIDLEFMGKPPAAPICSIGAVVFDPVEGSTGLTFYRRVIWADNSQSAPVDMDTVHWWMEQEKAARVEIVSREDRQSLKDALFDFTNWLFSIGFDDQSGIWGNGDDCDCVILEQAYNSVGMKTPWNFRQTRDVRTVVNMCRDLRGSWPWTGITPPVVKHHALEDVIYQADYVNNAYRLMK